jgi:energy-coupling factor transporter ATPase
MATAKPLIEIHDLSHTYQGNGTGPVNALQGISLTFRPGEFVAIVGANGSGKTTLARHLNALLLPTRGQVLVDGTDTRDRARRAAIRSQVAMVFQRPEDQIVATMVEDDVAFGPENLGLPTSEIQSRVRWALETVGMWDLRHRPPHLLSAGQQQRVATAGALAMRPRCLVLDEATAMLDPAGRRELLALLHELHREGLTILLITHWMHEAALAERVVVLDAGRVAFDGSPRRLFTDLDRLASLGLEPPPMVTLVSELARRWPDFPPDLLTLDELATALLPRLPRDGVAPAHRPAPPPNRDAPSVVAVRDLRYTYLAGTPLATEALDGVSLQVQAGEVVALLGPTGSGKSTLLQHIAGLLQPQTGQVLVNGQDVNAALARAGEGVRHRPTGMLFQQPEQQLFETYVGDDVAFGPRRLGLDRAAVRERVRWAMETAGLPFDTFKDRFTQSLSGGEKRKAALAGVLALHPQVLLLDEPTAGLDPQSRQGLLATLRHLNQEQGITLIVATHAMEDVVALAHRAFVLDRGQLVTQGTPRQLFREPDLLVAHGLGVPEVTALMHRLRAAGADLPADVLTVTEAVTAIKGAPA